MSHVLRKLAPLAFVMIALSVPTAAKAGFIQQIDPYPSTTTPFNYPLIFNSFNTSLGTLTAVTIIVSENGTVTSSVINTGGSGSYTNFTNSGVVTVTGPDGTIVSSALSTAPVSGSFAAGSGFSNMQVGSVSGSASVTSNITSNFGSYESASPLTYTVYAMGTDVINGTKVGSNIYFGGASTVGGTVEIDYTYTPNAVPEPASLAMVVVGLGGVFAARRFRRRTV